MATARRLKDFSTSSNISGQTSCGETRWGAKIVFFFQRGKRGCGWVFVEDGARVDFTLMGERNVHE